MMGDRVARWAASIRLMRLVTWTPHHIREQRCSLLDVGCENTLACPMFKNVLTHTDSHNQIEYLEK